MKTKYNTEFWSLREPCRRVRYADWDEGMDYEGIVCPANDGHQRAGKRTTDLRIVLPGGHVEDFVWFQYGGECLIQDKVLQIFQKNDVTGFEVKPVQARFEKGSVSPPVLWEPIITGWAGVASPESGIVLDKENSCPVCGHLHYTEVTDYSKLINPGQWDGSDIFMVWPLPRFVFVSGRLRQIIESANLIGCSCYEPKNLPIGRFHSGFSPGRLSYYMPEKRARELGEAIGIF